MDIDASFKVKNGFVRGGVEDVLCRQLERSRGTAR